ncbi:RNase H-like domain found in reverse transcriptase [Popillia japonica]|uniref:RNase H-like domain found in reverse transcriptase n=1 Tax=Popillia japonica TaxID=7064 RepID=A0AAW1LRT8_POPJA
MVVTATKDVKIRISTDFTQLTKSVKREAYQLPSVEETLGKIQDRKVFSKLDGSSGFYQLQLTKESFEYTTFITSFGRFAYQRCRFGISSGPEIFQRTLQNIIHNSQVKGVVVHADDIVKDAPFVWGQSQQKSFNDIKILLTTVPTLAAYNVQYPTRISTDSSSYGGVGGVLEQLQPDSSWRLISYCSKSLSIAEQKYAQIEKEALAIAYTCKRFNQ